MSSGHEPYGCGPSAFVHRPTDSSGDLRRHSKPPFHTSIRRSSNDEELASGRRHEFLFHSEHGVKRETERRAYSSLYDFFGRGFEHTSALSPPPETQQDTSPTSPHSRSYNHSHKHTGKPTNTKKHTHLLRPATAHAVREALSPPPPPTVPEIDWSTCLPGEPFYRVPTYANESGTAVASLLDQLEAAALRRPSTAHASKSKSSSRQAASSSRSGGRLTSSYTSPTDAAAQSNSAQLLSRNGSKRNFRLFFRTDRCDDLALRAAREMSIQSNTPMSPSGSPAADTAARTAKPEVGQISVNTREDIAYTDGRQRFSTVFRRARDNESMGTKTLWTEDLNHTHELDAKVMEQKRDVSVRSAVLANLSSLSYPCPPKFFLTTAHVGPSSSAVASSSSASSSSSSAAASAAAFSSAASRQPRPPPPPYGADREVASINSNAPSLFAAPAAAASVPIPSRKNEYEAPIRYLSSVR